MGVKERDVSRKKNKHSSIYMILKIGKKDERLGGRRAVEGRDERALIFSGNSRKPRFKAVKCIFYHPYIIFCSKCNNLLRK